MTFSHKSTVTLGIFAGAAFLVLIALLALLICYLFDTGVRTGIRTLRKKGGHIWVLVRLLIAVPAALVIIYALTPALAPASKLLDFTSAWGSPDILAFVAIVFALVQFLDARDEEGSLGEITGSLSKIRDQMSTIRDQMSTHVIGRFPKNLSEVAGLVRDARESIKIVADFLSYGQYSAPDDFKAYFDALKAAAKDPQISLEIAVYDPGKAKTEIEKQFLDSAFEKEKEKPAFNRFCATAAELGKKPPANAAELCALLQQLDDEYRNSLQTSFRGRVECKPLDEPLTLFVWLVDDREAIFTFGHIERKKNVYSIRTRDGDLVRQLREYVSDTLKSAKGKTSGE